jgi:hypothetical protein
MVALECPFFQPNDICARRAGGRGQGKGRGKLLQCHSLTKKYNECDKMKSKLKNCFLRKLSSRM